MYFFHKHPLLLIVNVFALILYKNKTKPTVVIFQKQKISKFYQKVGSFSG